MTSHNSRALQCVLSSHRFLSCTQALYLKHFERSKWLGVSALADLKHLKRLQIVDCYELEEPKMDYAGMVPNRSQPFCFPQPHEDSNRRLQLIEGLHIPCVRSILRRIKVNGCRDIQEIVSDAPEVMRNLYLFAKLHYLGLSGLSNLQSVYRKPLLFPHLKEMKVIHCDKLKKLPLDSYSARERKIVIRGYREWWEQLQWEDQAAQNDFLPCFQSIDGVRY